jgi:hypothetical protein
MRRGRVGAILVGLLGSCPVARAQNLVANGEFDAGQGVASWTAGSMSLLEWNTLDWQGDPASGSGRMTNAAPCASTSADQCLVLPQPLARSYELGASILVEPAGSVTGTARVTGSALAGTSCGGFALSTFATPMVSVTSEWTPVLENAISLPPNAGSVWISLEVSKLPFLPGCLPPLGPASARFDHVRFGPTGTTPVRLQSLSIQ